MLLATQKSRGKCRHETVRRMRDGETGKQRKSERESERESER